MIDTDKYEGHTPAPWMNLGSDANSLLMQDAPLLLAEVKRLREKIKTEHNLKLWEKAEVKRLRKQFKLAYDWVDTQFPDGGMADFAKYIGDD